MPDQGKPLLDGALDAMIEGDYERAEADVRRHLAAYPDDPDAVALLDVLVESGHEPPSQAPTDAVPFRCVACGHMAHDVREVVLNTRGLSFMGWDALNRSADCHICQRCGLIHWFLRPAPGALQALHPAGRGATDVGAEGPGGCMVCGFDRGYGRSQLLNTRGLTFFGLDFLNEASGSLVCARCGHMHWHVGAKDGWTLPALTTGAPDPPLPEAEAPRVREGCLACGGGDLLGRKVLLNSRAASHFGFDWLNQGAMVLECHACRFLGWFVRTRWTTLSPS